MKEVHADRLRGEERALKPVAPAAVEHPIPRDVVESKDSPSKRPDIPSESQPSFLFFWKRRGLMIFASDLAVILLSFVAAYHLRFYFDWLIAAIPIPVQKIPSLGPYVKVSILAGAVWVFTLWKEQIYTKQLHLSRSLAHQIKIVLKAGLYSMVCLMAMSFLFRYFLLSRVVYVTAFGMACSALIVIRIGLDLLDRYLGNHGITLNRVLLMGSQLDATGLMDRLHKRSRCTRVIGRLIEERDFDGINSLHESIPILGMAGDIEGVYESVPFDQLIIGGLIEVPGRVDAPHSETLISALNFCEGKGISVYMIPDSMDIAVRRREVGTLAGVPLISLKDSSLHPLYVCVKRALDISISITVMLIGMPLWMLISLLIKCTSKGPVFYVQERVGLHGKPFRMHKFRSMVHDADERLRHLVDFETLKEPVFNIRQDPRATSIGRILRRTSLDEVPQFYNVLMGSMSIVGPRPERLELANKYNAYQRRRLKGKPGITGYQQVMSRGDPSMAKRIECDLYYLKHQSFFLDLYILFRTVLVVLRGDGMK